MILFPNDTLDLYYRGSAILDGEGIVSSYQYALYKSVPADIQVTGAGSVDPQMYGLSNLNADDRIAFLNLDIVVAPMMKVVSRKTGVIYEMVQDQPYSTYMIVVLRPLQAGQVA